MLLISCHVLLSFSNICIYLSFVSCFMPALTLKVDKGNYKGLKALYSLYKIVVYKGPEALLSLCETMTIYKGSKALLSLYETMTIYKGPKAL